MALSRFVLTSDVAVPCPTAAELVTTPAVPASTTAQFNAGGIPVAVTVSGGTVTSICVSRRRRDLAGAGEPWGRAAAFRDPAGNLVRISQA
jgi:hypothetical protein